MLAGAHKKSERVQHTEIYLLSLKVQYKHKTKLPLDMVNMYFCPFSALTNMFNFIFGFMLQLRKQADLGLFDGGNVCLKTS